MKQILFIFTSVLYSLAYGAEICLSTDCTFNGKTYLPGKLLDTPTPCFQLICDENGKWKFNDAISQNCDVCHVSDDPHFKTFDNNYYDWHGSCEYSLSQPACPYIGDPQYPPYGIFSDFDESFIGSGVSCLKTTTYIVNDYIYIIITHNWQLNTVTIEINEYAVPSPLSTTPVVATDCNGKFFPVVLWKDGQCVRIIGLDYSIHACPAYMFIFTSNLHQNQIGGLCGNYNGNPADDYMTKSCSGPAPIKDFATSWMTTDVKGDCNSVLGQVSQILEILKGCKNSNNYSPYRNDCENIVNMNVNNCGPPKDNSDIQQTIENCVKDCCADPINCGKWQTTAGEFICQIGENRKMTPGG